MFRKTKYVLWDFLPIDYKATEIYLEEMAAKGWMFDRIWGQVARFRAIEPSAIKFFVDVYKDGGPFTPEDTDVSIAYRKLCAEAGWTYISAQDDIQYFHAEVNQHPLPLQTDEMLKQKILNASMPKRELLSLAIMVFLSIFILLLYLPFTYKSLTDYVSLFATFGFPIFIFISIVSSINKLRWHYRMKRDVLKGYPLHQPTLKAARRRAYAVNIPLFLIFITSILAVVLDAIYNSNPLKIMMGPAVLGVAIGLVFRYSIKKRSSDKAQSFRYGFILFIILYILTSLFYGWYSDQTRDAYYSIDAIPSRFDLIPFESLIEPGDLLMRSFEYSSTPFIPKKYNYTALKEADNQSLYISVDYYQAFNMNISKFIFKSVVDDLEQGIKYQRQYLNVKEMSPDEQLKKLWQVDDLEISKSKDVIVIRKADVVIKINGDIDIYNETIIKKFVKLYGQ